MEGLKKFYLEFSLLGGTFYVVPPRKPGESETDWRLRWTMVDTYERRSNIVKKSQLRRFAGQDPQQENYNDIRCLILEIDAHENSLTHSELEVFLSIWEQFEVKRYVSIKQEELLKEFLKRLDTRDA